MASGTTVEALLAVAADYVEGMVEGDERKLRRAFHPRASSIGHFDGGTEWDDLDAFVAGCKANAAPPENGAADWRLLSLEVTGDTAVMKLEDTYLGLRFTDTLTLMLHDGRWQIVAKVFWQHGQGG